MRLGQTSVVYFLSRITASLLGFGATLYFARELGAEPLGIYSLVLGVVSWLSIAGAMGIPAATSKRVSEGTDREEFAAGGFLLVVVLVGLLLGGVAVFRGQLNAYIGYPAAGFVALILVVSLLAQSIFSTMQGLHLVQLQGFLSPLRTGVRSGLQIGVLAVGGGLVGLFWGYVAGYVVAFIVGGSIVVRRLGGVKLPDRTHLRSLVDFARFAWISDIRSKAFNWLDIVILGFFVAPSLIGIYAVAWNIAQFLILFSSSIATTTFPEMSQLSAEEDAQAAAGLFKEAVSYAGLFLIPGVVGSLVVGERLLRLYSDEFTQGVAVLSLLVVACLIQAYQNQVMTTLNAVDRPDLAFRVNGVFLLTNLTLNVVLIYFYGWIGAAVATGLSAFISLGTGLGYLRSLIAVDVPVGELAKQWGAAGVMGLVVYGLRAVEDTTGVVGHNAIVVVLLVGTGAGVYFLVLLALSTRFRATVRRNLPMDDTWLPR
jgi:O-antigen/teichoic acid export membrane protein